MFNISVRVTPDTSGNARFLQLMFGQESNQNILQFDTYSVGDGTSKMKATDWNAAGVEAVLAAIPAAIVTDEQQRAALEIELDEELPALMTLVRAEGETRPFREILNELEAAVQQLPDDSAALAQMPRVMAEVKAIQFRAAENPEVEYPQYPRPLSIGVLYTEVGDRLGMIDLVALEPRITENSIFEILMEFEESESAPKYDYSILLQQLSGFADDHYNTYRLPTQRLLDLLMQYGLVTPDTTLDAFIAKGLENAKAQTDAQSNNDSV